jgi:ketosteroid isomerase-like protein
MTCNAQNKAMIGAMANAKLLDATVFGTKDSVTLDKLFAKTLSYVHSGGKVENREEALKGIIHNRSVYTQSTEPFPYDVSSRGDSMVVVHVFKANEKKADGTESLLNLSIEMVWIKEKKDWKLARRKATKVL